MDPETRTLKRGGKRGPGCALAVIALLVVSGLLVMLAVFGVIAAARGRPIRAPVLSHRMGADEYPDLREVWSYGSGETKVVAIPLTGMIVLGNDGGGLFGASASSADLALMAIRRATRDRDVRALILRVDSGGGGITASDVLYKAILDFKAADTNRRVVALFGDVAASGAYYVSLAADRIIAHPTTLTGSIGVLIQTFNVREMAAKLGIRDVTIKSGENKDLLNPMGELTPAQQAMLQGLVNELHERFTGLVAEKRRLPVETVRALADGRVFSASRAIEAGLVDGTGYWEDAVAETAKLLGVDTVKVFRYEEEFSFSALFRASQSWNPVESLLRRGGETRLQYRWAP